MRKTFSFPIIGVLALAAVSLPAQQANSGMAMTRSPEAAAPSVGQIAPDFTAPAANASGAMANPVQLDKLRGHVVVLAFYPKDRSSGCTAELTKFRDEYSKLFAGDVTVLPISVDSMDSHVGWAHDAQFPFSLVSDPSAKVATEYGSVMNYKGQQYASRTVYVIGRDGRITYRELKFGALDQHAYDALQQAVAQAVAQPAAN